MRTWAIVLIFLASAYCSAQSERSLVREGNRQYAAKKFADSETSYRKALESDRSFHQGVFNLGDALYKQERYEEAVQQYQSVAGSSSDNDVRGQSFHNLGNALLKSGKAKESIDAYKNSLRLRPDDLDTKYNLEYARMMLKQQQQEQQNKSDKDKQKQDDKKQDQPKQDQQKQDEQKQKEQQQKEQKQQQAQNEQRKQKMSKEDAERILEALKNEERNVQKRLQKKVPARISVEKDW